MGHQEAFRLHTKMSELSTQSVVLYIHTKEVFEKALMTTSHFKGVIFAKKQKAVLNVVYSF